jgi:hypothetical protein
MTKNNKAGKNNSGGSNYNYYPLKFIDAVNDHKHIVLFYEDRVAAKKIEYRYIKNGLSKGQHCIYTTHADGNNNNNISFIENQMSNIAGIDVEGFKKRNLLHIYKISNPMHNKEGVLKGVEDIMSTILADSKPPFRIVSRLIPEIITEEQIAANIKIESTYHSTFHKFPGILLCPYPVNKIEPSRRGQ